MRKKNFTKVHKSKKIYKNKYKDRISSGNFGLLARQSVILTGEQLEAARRVLVKKTRRVGKLWIKIRLIKPITKKPKGSRMGKGSGPVVGNVAYIPEGKALFEVININKAGATTALKATAKKLPKKFVVHVREFF